MCTYQTECVDDSLVDLPTLHALIIFLANMNPQLQMHVHQFNPTILGELAHLSKLHESSLLLAPLKYQKGPQNIPLLRTL